MPCLSIWPAPECGWNGKCVEFENETFCECDPGWGQTSELNFFVEKDDLASSICIYNESFMKVIYALICACGFVINVAWIQRVRKRGVRYLYKQKFTLLWATLIMIWAIYRLMNSDVLLGVDVTFSLMYTFIEILFGLSSYPVVRKHLRYVMGKSEVMNPRMRRQGEFLQKLAEIQLGMRLAFANSFWIASILSEKDKRVSLILLRLFCFLNAFASVYIVIIVRLFYNELVKDMERLIAGPGMNVQTAGNEDFIELLRVLIPNIRKLKVQLQASAVISIILWGIPVVSDFWFLCLIYLIPIGTFNVALGQMAMAVSKAVKRRKTSNNEEESTLKSGSITIMDQSKNIDITM